MLLINANLATMHGEEPYGLIPNACIVIKGGKIEWAGAHKELPIEYASFNAQDLEGRLVTPALIDCHTHLVHGGNRAVEFEMRLNGASYEELARAGGGIVSTVKATREAAVDELVAEGVSVLEIKSGYGLDEQTELNMLRAARALEKQRPVRVLTSFLGAHAIPKEFDGKPMQ